MQISPVNSLSGASSISGMRTAITRHDITAGDVANVNTQGYSERTPYQTDVATGGARISAIGRTPNSPQAPSNTDLTTEVMEQIENKNAVAANSKVFKVKDRMVGELLDLFA